MSSTATTASKGSSPILKFLVGVALILLWIVASLLQIQTSESFILNGPVVHYAADWAILYQPYYLVTGQLTPTLAKAVMWGWGVELIFLVCVIGYEEAHATISEGNKRLANIFRIGSFAIIAFDAWTDFNYGSLPSGIGGQLAFAAITAFIVMFAGVAGVHLVVKAMREFSHQ